MADQADTKPRKRPPFRPNRSASAGRQGQAARGRAIPPAPLETALLYGHHPVVEALQNPARTITALWLTQNAERTLGPLAAARGITPTLTTPREITRRAPEGAVHQGILAEAKPLPDADIATAPLTGPVLVLDRVTDPHNVGAILRSAAAFGVSLLVTTKRFSPEATGVLAKSASGGLEHVPWAKETNLARAMEALRARGVPLIGLDGEAPLSMPAALAEMLHNAPDGPPPALVLGAEGPGLREKTKATCDALAFLPLPGALSSLNVSNAAAIALTHCAIALEKAR